jgi:flagellar hook-basal body complex protein FliE
MAIDPVAFLPPLKEIQAEAGPAAADFGPWLARALGRVNHELVHADEGLRSLATGETENLHQVMIALEEARLGLQLVAQVRNRLLEAYQEVLRMQV